MFISLHPNLGFCLGTVHDSSYVFCSFSKIKPTLHIPTCKSHAPLKNGARCVWETKPTLWMEGFTNVKQNAPWDCRFCNYLQLMFINATSYMFKTQCPQNEKMQFRSNYNSWVDVLASRQMCNTSKLVPSMRLLGKFLINFNASFALIAKPHGSHQHLHLRAKNEETKAMQSWNWNQTTPENRPMPHQFQMNEHCFAALCFQRTTVLFVFPSASQHIAPLGQATEYPRTCGPKVHGPAEAAYMDEEIQLHMSSMVLVCSCAWLASVRRKKCWYWFFFHTWSLRYEVLQNNEHHWGACGP